MKHIAKIQVEFLKKVARDWEEMSYEEQKKYLKEHRKSKRRITAKPSKFGKPELPKGYSVSKEPLFGTGLEKNIIKNNGDSDTFVAFDKAPEFDDVTVTFYKDREIVKVDFLKDMKDVYAKAVDFLSSKSTKSKNVVGVQKNIDKKKKELGDKKEKKSIDIGGTKIEVDDNGEINNLDVDLEEVMDKISVADIKKKYPKVYEATREIVKQQETEDEDDDFYQGGVIDNRIDNFLIKGGVISWEYGDDESPDNPASSHFLYDLKGNKIGTEVI